MHAESSSAGLAVPALVASLGVLAAPPASAWEARDAALRRVGRHAHGEPPRHRQHQPGRRRRQRRRRRSPRSTCAAHNTSLAPASTLKTAHGRRRPALPRLRLPVAHRDVRTPRAAEPWRRLRQRLPQGLRRPHPDGAGPARDRARRSAPRASRGSPAASSSTGPYFDGVRYNPCVVDAPTPPTYYAAQVSALTLAPDTDYDSGTLIVVLPPRAPRRRSTRPAHG